MRTRTESRTELFGTGYRVAVERVAANVRALREGRGWTQEEAAFQCKDLDPTVFRVVEAARTNITIATLVRLAEGFGVDVQRLLDPAPPLEKRGRGRPKKASRTASSAASTLTEAETVGADDASPREAAPKVESGQDPTS